MPIKVGCLSLALSCYNGKESPLKEVTSSSLILGVEDAKECKQVLEQHHIETGELVDYEVVYVFDVLDPDNNQISFAQEV